MALLLSTARAHHCRWIVCEASDPTRKRRDLFRGVQICGAPASGLTSYCAEHRLRVYDAAPATRAPQDHAVARREPDPDTQPELTEIFS